MTVLVAGCADARSRVLPLRERRSLAGYATNRYSCHLAAWDPCMDSRRTRLHGDPPALQGRARVRAPRTLAAAVAVLRGERRERPGLAGGRGRRLPVRASARRAGLTEGLYAAPGSAAGARCVVPAPLQ